MLACDTDPPSPGYVLYVETDAPDKLLDMAMGHIEARLQANFHYRYARELGQLAPLRAFRAQAAAATYISRSISNGQRAGDIKPLALDRRNGWSSVFRGRFVSEAKVSGQEFTHTVKRKSFSSQGKAYFTAEARRR